MGEPAEKTAKVSAPGMEPSASTASEPTMSEVEQIMTLLKTVNKQNQRLAKYQEVSYRWHLQHHQNLKKIIAGINRISEMLQEQGAVGSSSSFHIVPEESTSLLEASAHLFRQVMPEHTGVLTAPVAGPRHTSSEGLCLPSPQNSGHAKTSFHDVVMSYRDRSHSRELKELLCNITLEQFQEIRESSVEVILPIIAAWLQDPTSQDLAFVYLWEVAKRFPLVFQKSYNQSIVRDSLRALEEFERHGQSSAFTADEIAQLRGFMKQWCSSTYPQQRNPRGFTNKLPQTKSIHNQGM